MPSEEELIMVSFRSPKESLEALDKAAEGESRSRSAMLVYLLDNIQTCLTAIHKQKASSKGNQ